MIQLGHWGNSLFWCTGAGMVSKMTGFPQRESEVELPEHVRENRRYWDERAPQWVAAGERLWASEPEWGQWGVSNEEVPLLPPNLAGHRAIELGCGTGYVSAWMVRRGAEVVAVDNSIEQLATCRRLQREHAIDFETLHANAESLPYPDASFDLAISEYGAAIWADPYLWIPEAHRLLRPGGRLIFLGNSPLQIVCLSSDGEETTPRLQRPYFGLRRLDWRGIEIDPGGVEFNLPLSSWVRLFRETGFAIEDYREWPAPAHAGGKPFNVSSAWATDFPAEQAWILCKAG